MIDSHSDAEQLTSDSAKSSGSHTPARFLSGLRGIYRSYSLPTWLLAFDNLATRSRPIKVAIGCFERVRATFLGDLMFIGFAVLSALRCSLPSTAHGAVFALALYPNEKHAARRLATLLSNFPVTIGDVRLSNVIRNVLRPSAVIALVASCFRARRIVRTFQRDGHFLPLCQASKFVACYAVYLDWLRTVKPKAVVISTMTHPECWALVTAAHAVGIRTIFAAHASLPPEGNAVAPCTDLLLLYSEQCLNSCREVGATQRDFCFWGLDGETLPLRFAELEPEKFVLGLFLTAPVNEAGLIEVIRTLIAVNRPKYLLLRPHPIGFLSPSFDHLERDIPGVRLSGNRSLQECLKECDVVLSGNSNVHRDALRAGVPTMYVDGVDMSGYDLWRFVRGGYVPEHRPDLPIESATLRAFYSKEWRLHFRSYDASFDESPLVTQARVRQALTEYLNR